MLYVNNCCCTCLSTDHLINVHIKDADNVKILDKILFTLTEKDSIFDCAPLLVCEKCLETVNQIYNFKKSSMKTLDLFRNCLKQLIKNPFSDLVVDASQTNENKQCNNTSAGNSNDSNIVVIKVEPVADEEYENENETEVISDSEHSENQPLSLKINNVKSLNKNITNPTLNETLNNSEDVESNLEEEDTTLNFKGRGFHKKTICHPCGKKFIRDEYFINHILTCPKNDTNTKYAVLNSVSKQTKRKIVSGEINIDPKLLKIISSPNFKTKPKEKTSILDENQIRNVPSSSDNPEFVKNIIKPKIEKLERTICFLCKRRIAARFFRRHFLKCSKIRDEEKRKLKLQKELLIKIPKHETVERQIASRRSSTHQTSAHETVERQIVSRRSSMHQISAHETTPHQTTLPTDEN